MSTKRSETNETKRNARSSFPFVLLHPLFNPVVHPHERNRPCRRTRSPSTYLHAPMRAFFDSLASPVPRATRTPRRRSGSIFVNFASCVNVIVRRVGRPIPTAENGDVRGRSGDLNRHPLFSSRSFHPSGSVVASRVRHRHRQSSSSGVVVERVVVPLSQTRQFHRARRCRTRRRGVRRVAQRHAVVLCRVASSSVGSVLCRSRPVPSMCLCVNSTARVVVRVPT